MAMLTFNRLRRYHNEKEREKYKLGEEIEETEETETTEQIAEGGENDAETENLVSEQEKKRKSGTQK